MKKLKNYIESSIGIRLTLYYCAILLTTLVLCGFVVIFGMNFALTKEANSKIKVAISNIQNSLQNEKNPDLTDPELVDQAGSLELWIQIYKDNKLVSKSPNLGNIKLPFYDGPVKSILINGQEVLISGKDIGNGIFVEVAHPLKREKHFLAVLSGLLIFLMMGATLFAMTSGYISVTNTLKPLAILTRKVKEINTGKLDERILLSGPKDELYLLAQAFNEMLERLEKGFKSQQEFVAAASHDLRTPLSIIKSYNDLLKRWGKDDKKILEESIQTISIATQRMERLVNDLLFLARVESKPRINFVKVNIRELIEEIAKEAQALSQTINVTFSTCDLYVNADEDYLRRAIWALVDNAIKYNKENGEVGILSRKEGNFAVIDIIDTGIGIKEEALPRLFEKFYRVDSSRQSSGFGLGLSLSKEIIQLHGGDIKVKSKYKEGSTFSVYLPLYPPAIRGKNAIL
ncbi:Signal transduction histidine kinase [Thermodesulfobium acidiphilum]|uniref:histidine kinase n=1 Tax=Thermodesulfobium acidiphilum TaxID=1794699 RepID=A0A2R4W2H2_THEAF|nr:HAMP domain-containing sensor histidine kinase [Thermodesulfobium acidiphilum]AWB11009.1 Signal transduction histidine kinase [Thermodesulfobium acidiphilum]